MYKQLIVTELVKEAGRKSRSVFPQNSISKVLHTRNNSQTDMFDIVGHGKKYTPKQRYDNREQTGRDIMNKRVNQLQTDIVMPEPPIKGFSSLAYTKDGKSESLRVMRRLAGIRDTDLALKGKLPNKIRKQITNPMRKQLRSDIAYATAHPELEPNGTVSEYATDRINAVNRLFKPVPNGYMNDINDSIHGAKNIESMRFILDKYLPEGRQKAIMKGIPITGTYGYNSNNAEFAILPNTITLGKQFFPSFSVLGHETGHGLGYTQPYKPKEIRLAVGNNKNNIFVNDDNFDKVMANSSLQKRFKDPKQLRAVMNFYTEVDANRQIRKVMRKALAGNKPLYDEFRKLYHDSSLPAIATYMNGYENELRDAIQYLPANMQRRANNYLRQYDAFKQKAINRYSRKNPIPPASVYAGVSTKVLPTREYEHDAILNEVSLIDRANRKRNYAFNDKLYDYLQTQGMKPDTNMWWRHPNMQLENIRRKSMLDHVFKNSPYMSSEVVSNYDPYTITKNPMLKARFPKFVKKFYEEMYN